MSTHNICFHRKIRKYQYFSVEKVKLLFTISAYSHQKFNSKYTCSCCAIKSGLHCSCITLEVISPNSLPDVMLRPYYLTGFTKLGSAASDLGLLCLQIILFRVSRLNWVLHPSTAFKITLDDN